MSNSSLARSKTEQSLSYVFALVTREFCNCLPLQLVHWVWMMLYEQVQAYDELDMSVMRLRERLPDEPTTDAPQVYIIEPAEVHQESSNTDVRRDGKR